MTALRRSCRVAIQRLTNGFLFTNCNIEQTSLVLALSHLSGWSADHIALKLMDATLTKDMGRIQAEHLWIFFSNWISSRQTRSIVTTAEDIALMNDILEDAGISLTETTGKPLNMTLRPTTVIYNTMTWTPDTGVPLIPNFSMDMRAKSKEWMKQQSERVFLASPSPRELAIFEQFGEGMATIFDLVLKSWAKAVRRKLRNNKDKVPDLRPIKKKEEVARIMFFVDKYIDLYEDKFGKIENTQQPGPSPDKPISLTVQSTAFAGKIFLSLIMADRLEVADTLRRQKRDELGGFVYLEIRDLSEDLEACDICYDEWSPDEDREKPIQLVICCFKVLGESCMKKTISMGHLHKGKKNVSCPNCRYEFPDWFIEKFKVVESNHDEDSEESEQEEAVEEVEIVVEGEVQNVDVVVERISDADTTEIFVDASEAVEGEASADGQNPPNSMQDVQVIAEPGEAMEIVVLVNEASPDVPEEIRVIETEQLRDVLVEGTLHHDAMEGVQITSPEEVVVNLHMLPDEFVTTSGGDLRFDV